MRRTLTKIAAIMLVLVMLLSMLAACGSEGPEGKPGEKGDTGETGAQGIQGEKGDPGAQGEKGEKGDKGDKGDDGAAGANGADGITPRLRINPQTTAWEISYDNGATWQNLGVEASGTGVAGKNGETPYIKNGNWWIGTTDTGVRAEGTDGEKGATGAAGKDGQTPYIKNGTWWIGTTNTGVSATGIKGDKGDKGNTGATGATGATGKDGADGEDGLSAYEIYKKYNPSYTGSEKQWIEDYVNGTLTEYTVTFDLNGGTAPSGFKSSVKVNYGKTVSLSIPTRSGYSFIGWYTGTTVVDGAFTTTSTVTGDIKLIAIWEKNNTSSTSTYTVKFNTNGGNTIASQTVNNGAIPTKPADPLKSGYKFSGWYLDSGFKTAYNFGNALNRDVTLYAKMVDGVPAGYTPITSAAELANIAKNPAGKYFLMNDINLKGDLWTPVDEFTGILDGDGHKIYNFAISGTSDKQGFVRTNKGTIKNLNFDSFIYTYIYSLKISEKVYSGVITGYNNGTIENCHVTNGNINLEVSRSNQWDGDWASAFLGGIAGVNAGKMLNISIDSVFKIKGISQSTRKTDSYDHYNILEPLIGGAIGENSSEAIVDRISVYGSIEIEAVLEATSSGYTSDSDHIVLNVRCGGIIGLNYSSNVSNCIANNSISIEYSGTRAGSQDIEKNLLLGGIIGYNHTGGKMQNCICESTLKVTNEGFKLSSTSIGGIVGNNSNGNSVLKSVFTGNINLCSDVKNYGYIAGSNSGTVYMCHYNSASALKVNGAAAKPTCADGTATALSTIQTPNFIFNTLYWDDSIWQVTSGKNPSLK